MAKNTTRRKKNNYNEILSAMDLMMSSNHSSVVGRDFVLSRKTNPKYGSIYPDDLPDHDQEFIDYIVNLKALNKAEIPRNLEQLSIPALLQRFKSNKEPWSGISKSFF